MGVYLISMHLTRVHLIGVYLTGIGFASLWLFLRVRLMCVYL
jgi:hypothetical protein